MADRRFTQWVDENSSVLLIWTFAAILLAILAVGLFAKVKP